MSATGSSSKKPTVNVGVVGRTKAGMTTLTAAILKVQSKAKKAKPIPCADLANRPPGAVFVEYESNKRAYVHADFATPSDWWKTLISGGASLDGAIVVIDVLEESLPREQLALLTRLQVLRVVVFLNKCEEVKDEDRLSKREEEIRDELDKHRYEGGRTRVIRGSAKLALEGDARWEKSIAELLEALDDDFLPPNNKADEPFLMPIQDVQKAKDGVVVIGRVEQGVIKVGQAVEIVSFGETRQTVVTSLGMIRGNAGWISLQEGRFDNIDVLQCFLKGIDPNDVQVGGVLAFPGSTRLLRKLECVIYVPSKQDGGRGAPIPNGALLNVSSHIFDVKGTLRLTEGLKELSPGAYDLTTSIELAQSMPIEEGMHFALRQGTRTLGAGVVAKLLG